MKKYRIIAVVVLVVCFYSLSLGQGISEKGVIGGINYASFGGPDADDGDMDPKRLLRYAVGGFATFNLNGNLIIRPEVHYSMKGVKYEESEDGMELLAEMRMNYLDIPVLFVFTPQPKLMAYAGPMVGVYLSGETYAKFSFGGESESDTEDIDKEEIKNPDFGAVVGVGYGLTDKISVHARYSMGLITVDDADDVDIKHNSLQLLLSTTF